MNRGEWMLVALGFGVFGLASMYWVASIALAVRWWLE